MHLCPRPSTGSDTLHTKQGLSERNSGFQLVGTSLRRGCIFSALRGSRKEYTIWYPHGNCQASFLIGWKNWGSCFEFKAHFLKIPTASPLLAPKLASKPPFCQHSYSVWFQTKIKLSIIIAGHVTEFISLSTEELSKAILAAQISCWQLMWWWKPWQSSPLSCLSDPTAVMTGRRSKWICLLTSDFIAACCLSGHSME